MKRVEKFLRQDVCPDCGGTRLSPAARAPKLRGLSLDEACRMPLAELDGWVRDSRALRDAPHGAEHLRFLPTARRGG